jgi:PAS domain S-box-containing protein
MTKKKQKRTLAWVLVALTGATFIEELLILAFLDLFPALPKTVVLVLDATLLAAFIFPIFYFLVYRPLSQNIAELKQTGERLRTISIAFESKEPILITDAQSNILLANKSFLKLSGYSVEELIGQNPRIIKSERFTRDFYNKMWHQLLHYGVWSGEIRIKDKRGNEIPTGIVISAVKNEQKETTHYVAIYTI